MTRAVTIGVIGEFNPEFPPHAATNAALGHAAAAVGIEVDVRWLNTVELEDLPVGELAGHDALWCAPGSPYRSMDGALRAIRLARESDWPFLGTCGGFQHVVIEYARIPADVVLMLREALYTELARACEDAPVTMPQAHTHSGWADVLARIDGASKALDVIGWDAPTRQQDVEVELDATMIDALEADIDLWEWLAEQNRTETAKGRRRAATKATTIKRFLASIASAEGER
jgi:CTP synthase (UTP-ammonia lyase)